MKIYRCDKCGHEKQTKQIVGNEFEYFGFKTLEPAYQFGGVIDVCASCFQSVLAAKRAADKAADEAGTKTLLECLGVR